MDRLDLEKIRKIRAERKRKIKLKKAKEEQRIKEKAKRQINKSLENLQKLLEQAADENFGVCLLIDFRFMKELEHINKIEELPLFLKAFVDDLKKLGLKPFIFKSAYSSGIGVNTDEI